tara:strand:+ start:1158 stop:1532 length:375 start_codon:yes stop_codon:yes gene_type:complete
LLKLIKNLFGEIVAKLTCIKEAAFTLGTAFKANFQISLVGNMVHSDIAARAVNILHMIVLGAEELVADVDLLSALKFFEFFLLAMVKPDSHAVRASIDLNVIKGNHFELVLTLGANHDDTCNPV